MTLKAAVAGLGVGRQHALALSRLKGVEVAALCDASPERLAEAGRAFPRARRFARFEEVLSSGAGLVSIATYDEAHAAQVLAALKRGLHVFVEKPLCRTVAEARAIHRAWRRHGGRVKLASNLVLRSAPLYRWLKKEVARGALGEIYAFDGDYLYGRLEKITRGWRRKTDGYSVMAGGGIHLLDLLMWLTGQRPRRVAASGNRICSRGTAFRYDDFAAATFEFASGLVARVTANFGCMHKHQHVVRLFGTKATFILDDQGARVYRRRDPGGPARRIRLAEAPKGKGELIPGFVGAVREGRDISGETRSFFDGVCVAAACDRALKSGRAEEIRYL